MSYLLTAAVLFCSTPLLHASATSELEKDIIAMACETNRGTPHHDEFDRILPSSLISLTVPEAAGTQSISVDWNSDGQTMVPLTVTWMLSKEAPGIFFPHIGGASFRNLGSVHRNLDHTQTRYGMLINLVNPQGECRDYGVIVSTKAAEISK